MHRGITVGNKICAKWEDQRRQELHRVRVRNMRPVTDTSEPFALQMDHIRTNYKREQMLEERYSEIDRENRILLKKMSDIMKSNQNTPRGVVQAGPQSLNRDNRKQELLRITRENQHILKRIQQAQPIYNHIQWEAEHKKNSNYLANCSEYPGVFISKSARSPRSELVPLQAEDITNEHVPLTARSGVRQEPLPVIDALGDDVVKNVLKEGRQIGETTYLIEMSTDGRGALSISAYDAVKQTTLDLVVKATQYRQLIRETNGDHSLISQRLRITKSELGQRLTLDDGETAAMASMPASAREARAPVAASLPTAGQSARGPQSSPLTARVEGGRASKAAEGVRDRTAAYLQAQQPPKAPSPPAVSPGRSPPPLRGSPSARETPQQEAAETSQTGQAASSAAPKKSGRSAAGDGKPRRPAPEEELDADGLVAANNAEGEDSDHVLSLAGTVGSAGFPPGSAGSAWTCEVDFNSGGDPQVRLRGFTPDDAKL